MIKLNIKIRIEIQITSLMFEHNGNEFISVIHTLMASFTTLEALITLENVKIAIETPAFEMFNFILTVFSWFLG